MEGVWCSNYQSSRPLCVVGGKFMRCCAWGLTALRSLKRYVFQGSIRDPSRRSQLKGFLLKIVLSLRSGARVISWPMLLSTGSALGAADPKSLHFHNIFCLHISEKTFNTYSKSKLCRFCNRFWTHYKTSPQSDILCTRSRIKIDCFFFWCWIWKTPAARTHVQSVRAVCTFTKGL